MELGRKEVSPADCRGEARTGVIRFADDPAGVGRRGVVAVDEVELAWFSMPSKSGCVSDARSLCVGGLFAPTRSDRSILVCVGGLSAPTHSDRLNSTVFQPIWGILQAGSDGVKSFTEPGTSPIHGVPPSSSENSNMTCVPRQIPRKGFPVATSSRIGSMRPNSVRFFIASAAAPTPGKITRSSASTRLGSLVISHGAPMYSSASRTLVRLPAL